MILSVNDLLKINFLRQLSLGMSTGLPLRPILVAAFKSSDFQKHGNLSEESCNKLLEDLDNGRTTISEAFASLELFTEMDLAVIKAGEEGGILDTAVQSLIAYYVWDIYHPEDSKTIPPELKERLHHFQAVIQEISA